MRGAAELRHDTGSPPPLSEPHTAETDILCDPKTMRRRIPYDGPRSAWIPR